MDHVARHLIGPFEDLRSKVYEEGVGRPTSEYHDFVDGVIHEEQAHGGAGTDGLDAEICGEEPEGGLSTSARA